MMKKLRVNVRVDRYEPPSEVKRQYPIDKYFDIFCQTLRFDKDMNLVVGLSHTNLIKLRNQINTFIVMNDLKGRI